MAGKWADDLCIYCLSEDGARRRLMAGIWAYIISVFLFDNTISLFHVLFFDVACVRSQLISSNQLFH